MAAIVPQHPEARLSAINAADRSAHALRRVTRAARPAQFGASAAYWAVISSMLLRMDSLASLTTST